MNTHRTSSDRRAVILLGMAVLLVAGASPRPLAAEPSSPKRVGIQDLDPNPVLDESSASALDDLTRCVEIVRSAPRGGSECVAPTLETATSGEADTNGPEEPPKLTQSELLETARGPHVELAALGGTDNIVRVHQWGTAAVVTPEGETVWSRSGLGLAEQWGMKPSSVAPVGIRATQRFTIGVPFAVGDISGDGVDDVAVGVEHRGYWSDKYDERSIVTVLDGLDGRVLWHDFLAGSIHALVYESGALVIAHANGEGRFNLGEPGGRSELRAFRFTTENDDLVATQTWNLSTDVQWAPWASAIGTNTGSIVAAWEEPDAHHVLFINANTGVTEWEYDSDAEVQRVAYDPQRDEVVLALQDEDGYVVTGLSAADGATRATSSLRPSLGPLALIVEDVTGDDLPEWLLTEGAWGDNGGLVGSKVIAFDADTTFPMWEADTLGLWGPNAVLGFGLAAVDNKVFVAGTSDHLSDGPVRTTLKAYDGSTGAELWARTDRDSAFPSSLLIADRAGKPAIYAVTSRLEFRSYAPGDGTMLTDAPILGNVYSAQAYDVGGDAAIDLIVGTESAGVFALDGTSLHIDTPSLLWKTKIAGPAHEMHLGDLDDDDSPEIVVAAEHAVVVLNAATGEIDYEIPYPEDYVWTVSLADLNGDDHLDIIVPTRTVAAYRGADGEPLWSYLPDLPPQTTVHFSNAAVAPGRRVVVQYASTWQTSDDVAAVPSEVRSVVERQLESTVEHPEPSAIVGIDGTTGQAAWHRAMADNVGEPALWRGVAADPLFPLGEGHAVAVSSYPVETGYALARRVIDARTGDALTPFVGGESGPDMGIEALEGVGFTTLTWRSVSRLEAEGFRSRRNGSVNTDIASADFGLLGMNVVLADTNVRAIPTKDFDNGPLVIGLSSVRTSALLVHDLDADGIDEIVTFEHDWEAQDTVKRFTGGNIGNLNALFHGVGVLELVSSSPTPTPTPSPSPTATGSPSPSPSPSESPLPEDTEVSFTENSATSGQHSDEATFEARLTASNDDPIAGAALTFTLTGEESSRDFTVTTNDDGIATVTLTLEEKPGPYQLTVRYDGNEEHAGDADTVSFVVEKEDTALELSAEGEDDDKTLRAGLSDLDASSEGIAQRIIDFYSDGELIGSHQTDADGFASMALPRRHRGNNRTYEAVFHGDDFYLGSSDERVGKGRAGNGGGSGGKGYRGQGGQTYAGRMLP